MSEYPIVERLPVQWGEMDVLGHVNNARFVVWFEAARIALFRHVGLLGDALPPAGPVLATVTCDFLRPVTYPATVCIGTRITQVGTTSLTQEYAVWLDGRPDELVARGTSVAVIVDYATNAKTPVPDAVRARIAELGAR